MARHLIFRGKLLLNRTLLFAVRTWRTYDSFVFNAKFRVERTEKRTRWNAQSEHEIVATIVKSETRDVYT